jgi:hypothetical protein
MRHRSPIRLDVLFPHEKDELFQTVVLFEALVSQVAPVRGTVVFRNKLQRLVARLADAFIEFASGVSFPQAQRLLKVGLLSSRKAIGYLVLLKTAGALSPEQHERARKLVEKIAEKVKCKLETDDREQENSTPTRERHPSADPPNTLSIDSAPSPAKSDSSGGESGPEEPDDNSGDAAA